MLDAVPAGPLGFERRKLQKVVAKAIDTTTIIARPKGRFADRDAAHFGERLVVVGGPRDHVYVWVEVVHGKGCGIRDAGCGMC